MSRYAVRADGHGVTFARRVPGGNLPHGDPKLARLGVRQTPREWSGFTSTQITAEAEEDSELLEPLWGESMAAEAAATGETALITAEDAAILGSVGVGSEALTVSWLALGGIVGAVIAAGVAGYEIYEHSKHKSKSSPVSVLPEQPPPKRRKTYPGTDTSSATKRHLDFAHPLTSPDPKRQKPNPTEKINPLACSGDFSGLVTTFVYPTTGRIIGYKGIPQKHRFSALMASSLFWRNQMTPARELFASA